MEIDTITNLRDESESRCRVLFDKLQTLKAQAEEVNTELERSRGDFRTYSKLVNEWDVTVLAAPLSPILDSIKEK